MKPLLTFFVLSAPLWLSAQFYEISQGPGYGQSVFFDLSTRTSTMIDLDAWDIAFGVNSRSFAVFANEGVASSRSEALRPVSVFLNGDDDFTAADTTKRGDRLHNDETSWNAGAFNHVGDPANPLDVGWGLYSPRTQTVEGNRVFLVEDRQGNAYKMQILSLAAGVYTFVYSTLDAATPDTVTINKADFAGKTLAYFSFDDGVLDLEPDSWDLFFTRYTTPLDDGTGNILQYTLTGALHNDGVEVAELNGVNPATVAAPADDAFSDTLTAIGYDWKAFDLNSFQWSLPDDRVYFVRTADSLYRMSFIDFTGSSSGITTIELMAETTTATGNLPRGLEAVNVYPNPVADVARLEFELTQPSHNLELTIVDGSGRLLQRRHLGALPAGPQRLNLRMRDFPAGSYFLRLTGLGGTLGYHLIKR